MYTAKVINNEIAKIEMFIRCFISPIKLACNQSNTTCATYGAGKATLSGESEFTPVF
jgi:hypothetical protein